MDKLRVVSLFTGCGGSDLGILGGFNFLNKNYKKLPTEVVYANDIDRPCVSTYKENFGGHITCHDISDIPSCAIPEHNILVGGFPCQSFSIVGLRKGLNDPRGKLFYQMVRILKDHKPDAFIAENVKGLMNVDKGEVLKLIIKEFSDAGYTVEAKLLNAADYGVPQKRERVFIVGIKKSFGKKYKFPESLYSKDPEAGKKPWVALNHVIDNLEHEDQKYYFSERAVAGLKKSNKAFNKGRAQDLNQPCNTISSHLAKVSLNGTDPVLLVNKGKDIYRRFSSREAARIQSFPENFIFPGSELQAYKQIGNAIPPVLMWHVSKALVDQIQEK